jgi:hypothetical protein
MTIIAATRQEIYDTAKQHNLLKTKHYLVRRKSMWVWKECKSNA